MGYLLGNPATLARRSGQSCVKHRIPVSDLLLRFLSVRQRSGGHQKLRMPHGVFFHPPPSLKLSITQKFFEIFVMCYKNIYQHCPPIVFLAISGALSDFWIFYRRLALRLSHPFRIVLLKSPRRKAHIVFCPINKYILL